MKNATREHIVMPNHIARDENELEKIRDYIRRNPMMWAIDRYNPDRAVPVINEEARVVPWDES